MKNGRIESPLHCGRPEALLVSAASQHPQFQDDHICVHDDQFIVLVSQYQLAADTSRKGISNFVLNVPISYKIVRCTCSPGSDATMRE